MLHLSRSAVWRLTQDPTFPEPVILGNNVRWVRSEIEEWVLSRRARSAFTKTKVARHGRVDTLPEIVLVPA